MEFPGDLHCLFTARHDQTDGASTLDVPAQELQLWALSQGDTYRLAVLPTASDTATEGIHDANSTLSHASNQSPPDSPVEEGETHESEIESPGDQGDGSSNSRSECSVRSEPCYTDRNHYH